MDTTRSPNLTTQHFLSDTGVDWTTRRQGNNESDVKELYFIKETIDEILYPVNVGKIPGSKKGEMART